MMIKKQLLIGWLILGAIFTCPSLFAQQLDKERYLAFKVGDWKGDAAPNLIDIHVIENPLSRVSILTDNKSNSLNGRYHIIYHMHKYLVADVSKGLLDGEAKLYIYNEVFQLSNYKQGILHGKQHGYSNNETYTYDNGAITHYISYHDNSQLKEERNYVNKELHGDVIIYNEEGKITNKKGFINGKSEGEFIEVFPSGYKAIANYKKGLKLGEYQEVYPNNIVAIKGSYGEHEKKTGLWTKYEEDGRIKEEENYLNGLLHGEQKNYTKGTLYQLCEYANGKQNGKRFYYRGTPPHMRLAEEESYVDGKLDGVLKRYNEGNILYTEVRYKEGNRISEKSYDTYTGTIMTETLYRDNNSIGQKVYNRQGVLKVLRLINERGSLVDVQEYNTKGQVIKSDKTYKRPENIKLLADEWGIIDIP